MSCQEIKKGRKSKIHFGFLHSLLIHISFLFSDLAWAGYVSRLSGLGIFYHQNSLLTRCCFALDCRFVGLSSHILYHAFSKVKLPRRLEQRGASCQTCRACNTCPSMWGGSLELGVLGKVPALSVGSECCLPGKFCRFCTPNSLQMPTHMSSSTRLSCTWDEDREHCPRINKNLARKIGKTVVEQHFFLSSFALFCKVTILSYGSECSLDLISELR